MPVVQAAFVVPARAGGVGNSRSVEYLRAATRTADGTVASPYAELLSVLVQIARTPDGGACQRRRGETDRTSRARYLHVLLRAFRAGGEQQHRRQHGQDSEGVLSSVHIFIV